MISINKYKSKRYSKIPKMTTSNRMIKITKLQVGRQDYKYLFRCYRLKALLVLMSQLILTCSLFSKCWRSMINFDNFQNFQYDQINYKLYELYQNINFILIK